jgi:hypothetical protein
MTDTIITGNELARADGGINQTVVLFGNSGPMMQTRNPTGTDENGNTIYASVGVPAEHIDQSVTRVEMWVGYDDPEFVNHTLSTDNDRILSMIARSLSDEDKKYAIGISEIEQVWSVHSSTSKPNWVDSNDKEFARVLSQHFGCALGEPQALLTTAGRDALHAQHMSTSAQPASFNYMGLANNATAVVPAAGDTALTGEITTAGGGLIRAQATYAHTAGTNTTTLTKTFTANGTDSLPVTVSQMGIFNASTAGTMSYKTALNANATITVSGDNITVTETVTGG